MDVVIKDEDLRTLLFCSIRYAVGRQTYMPNLVRVITKQHVGVLSDTDRKQLAREIEQMADFGNPDFGNPRIDEPGWKAFIAWLRIGDPPPRV